MKRLFVILILISLGFFNCSQALINSATSLVHIKLSYERYNPRLQTDKYSAFNNKSIFLSSFSNNAKNTTVFYYFSPDYKIKYGEYALSSYYWYCFAKAFNSIGITTYKDTAPSNIPEFTFEFDYLTDQKMRYRVKVSKRYNVVYQRQFIIKMPAPDSTGKAYLEDRAYQMVDAIIINILNDQNFAASL